MSDKEEENRNATGKGRKEKEPNKESNVNQMILKEIKLLQEDTKKRNDRIENLMISYKAETESKFDSITKKQEEQDQKINNLYDKLKTVKNSDKDPKFSYVKLDEHILFVSYWESVDGVPHDCSESEHIHDEFFKICHAVEYIGDEQVKLITYPEYTYFQLGRFIAQNFAAFRKEFRYLDIRSNREYDNGVEMANSRFFKEKREWAECGAKGARITFKRSVVEHRVHKNEKEDKYDTKQSEDGFESDEDPKMDQDFN